MAKQQNANDCGTFALAFATNLVHDVYRFHKKKNGIFKNEKISATMSGERRNDLFFKTQCKLVTVETKTASSSKSEQVPPFALAGDQIITEEQLSSVTTATCEG